MNGVLCRIGGGSEEQSLAGRVVEAGQRGRPYVVEAGAASPHFISDCFFLTQRAVTSCLIPASASACFTEMRLFATLLSHGPVAVLVMLQILCMSTLT